MGSNQTNVLLVGCSAEDASLLQKQVRATAPDAATIFHFEIAASIQQGNGFLQVGSAGVDVILLAISPGPDRPAEEIQAVLAGTPPLPLILLTDIENEQYALQALEYGAVDYLVREEINPRLFARSLRYAVERKKAELASRSQREYVASILESLPHPFYVLDAVDYQVKIANEAARALCNGELTTCYALTHLRDVPCTGAEHDCPLEVVRQTRKPHTTLHLHYDGDGQERVIEIHGYPILDEEGEVAEMIEYAVDITDRVRAAEQTRFHAQLLSNVRESLIATDLEGLVVYWSKGAEALYGYHAEEVSGKPFDFGVDESWSDSSAERRAQIMETGNWTGQFWKQRKDGTQFLADTVIFLVRDETGEPTGMIGIDRDITGDVQNQEKARLAAQVFDTTSEAIIITDARAKIISVNKAFSEITGYEAEEVIGRNPRFLKSGRHNETYYKNMWAMLNESGFWRGEIWNRRKDGEIYPEWLTISAVKNQRGVVTNYMAIFIDISQQKQNEELLRFLATHDPLTNLPNRELFRNRLRRAIARSQRQGKKVAVLLMDLDGFKAVNDTLGHTIGDQVLQSVAERLVESVRESDTVARLGGDEFTVILEGIASEADAALVVQKIIKNTTRPYRFNGYQADLTTSIGISVFPDDAGDGDTLITHADTAMYRAKSKGKGRYFFYSRRA